MFVYVDYENYWILYKMTCTYGSKQKEGKDMVVFAARCTRLEIKFALPASELNSLFGVLLPEENIYKPTSLVTFDHH